MPTKEIIRFLIAGGINTLLAYFIYLGIIYFTSYQIAYALAYICGIIISYWLNLRYVFRQSTTWKKFISYPFIYLLQYLINALLLGISVEWLNIPSKIAPLIVILFTIPITFVLTRFVLGAVDNSPA